MKPCDKHWAAMCEAIEARGLSHLVKTAEQNHANIASQLDAIREGRTPPADDASSYDPRMSMYWMVTNRALAMGGLYLMTTPPEGSGDEDYCPVCEAMKNLGGVPYTDAPEGTPVPSAEDIERQWIDGPADAAHAHCVQLGLVSRQ